MTDGRARSATSRARRSRRRSTPARRSGSTRPASRSRSASGRRLFDGRFGLGGRAAGGAGGPARRSPATRSSRPAAAATCAIQACADDPQVAFHAVRNLARLARGRGRHALVPARLRPDVVDELGAGHAAQPDGLQGRHQQPRRGGHGERSSRSSGSAPTRTRRGCAAAPTSSRGASGCASSPGTAPRLDEQERVIGREQGHRRALRRQRPSTTRCRPRRHRGGDGAPIIAADAHIRLAAPATNGGEQILRRGYSFTDGIDQRTGELDAGPLLHLLPARSTHASSSPIQRAPRRRATRSTSTSATPAAPSSPARPAHDRTVRGGTGSSRPVERTGLCQSAPAASGRPTGRSS